MRDMQCQAAFNETLSVRGLVKGQLKLSTEAPILAAQDNCIYTCSFKANCMGNAGDTHCRQCDEGVGTVTHHLVEEWCHLPTVGKAVSQIEGMHHSVLCSSV